MIRWLIPLLLLTSVAQAQQLVSPIEVKDCGADRVKSISATGLVGCGSVGSGAVSSVAASNGSLTISPTTGAVLGAINLSNANAWTGKQGFSETEGEAVTISFTTYTIPACGKTYIFTSSSAVTVTIPASLAASGKVCPFAVWQHGAGTVSLTGSAVTAATRVSRPGYSATAGQYAIVGITLTSISGTAYANIIGDGQ